MSIPEFTAKPSRRGATALTRWILPPRAPAAGVLEFPSRAVIPRRWEAVLPCIVDLAVVAAALAVLFPGLFVGWRGWWLVVAAPAAVQAAMIASGMGRVLAGPWFPARFFLGLVEAAALAVAATGSGWPRAVAALAAGILGLEILCRLVLPASSPPPEP